MSDELVGKIRKVLTNPPTPEQIQARDEMNRIEWKATYESFLKLQQIIFAQHVAVLDYEIGSEQLKQYLFDLQRMEALTKTMGSMFPSLYEAYQKASDHASNPD